MQLDTLQKEERNSGFIGGRFLERCRIKNPTTNTYYKPEDFFLGATLSINSFVFHVIDQDGFTKVLIDTARAAQRPITHAATMLGLDRSAVGKFQVGRMQRSLGDVNHLLAYVLLSNCLSYQDHTAVHTLLLHVITNSLFYIFVFPLPGSHGVAHRVDG
jgi:hypothetical protein